MDDASMLMSPTDWAAWTTAFSTIVLTLATIALAYLTWLLAKATSRPSVVATIEPNRWTLIYLDLHLLNEGNASAYDVQLAFSPALPPDTRGRVREPFANVSLLRAGQRLVTNLSGYADYKDKAFEVTISWRDRPQGKRLASTYTLDLGFLNSISSLGGDPEVSLAQELKKIREAFEPLARGRSRLAADVWTSADREAEEAERERYWTEVRERDAAEGPSAATSVAPPPADPPTEA